MKLNVQTLKNDEKLDFDEILSISLESLHLSSSIKDYMARIYGTVTKKGDLYTVSGYVDLELELSCDRCMCGVTDPIHAELFCEFSSDERRLIENEDIKQVTKSSIDLSDAVLESIAMNLPMKVLCNEDCKGMCKGCGTNLNKSTCQCAALDIDPRLEQFKNIFE